MADTIIRLEPRSLSVAQVLWAATLEAVCARRGHNWRLCGRAIDREGEWNLPFGRRDYCTRCQAGRIVLKADGSCEYATKAEVLALEPRFAEALYEARWGERPRRRLWRGEWVAT